MTKKEKKIRNDKMRKLHQRNIEGGMQKWDSYDTFTEKKKWDNLTKTQVMRILNNKLKNT